MTELSCTKCNETKDIELFSKDSSKTSGHRRECRRCVSLRTRSKKYWMKKEKLSVEYKRCMGCIKAKLKKDFHKDSTKKDGYYSICKDCRRKRKGVSKQSNDKRISSDGYILVKSIRQHRLIMENVLGRKLSSKEHVHHKNGIKTDNRLENLEVMDESNHHSYHSKIISGARKNGKLLKCQTCGIKIYRSKYHIKETKKIIECKNCYYKNGGATGRKLRLIETFSG